MSDSPTSFRDRVRSLQLPEGAGGRRPFGRWWLPWALTLLLAASTAYLAVRTPPAGTGRGEPVVDLKSAGGVAGGPAGGAAEPGPAAPDRSDPKAILLESKGYIVPLRLIKVSPEVQGRVVKLYPKLKVEGEGVFVRAGEPLADLERTEYLAECLRAQGRAEAAWQQWFELATGYRPEEVLQAKAELEEAEAELDRLQADINRIVNLKRVDAVSPGEYEQTYSTHKAMTRKVERLRLGLELLRQGQRIERIDAAWADVIDKEADLFKSQWRLGKCTVTAPEDGTILQKKAEEGDIVNPVAFNISASICEMANLKHLEVDVRVAERDIGKVFDGQLCQVRAEAYPKRVYPGRARRMPLADRAKGAVPVRVRIDPDAIPEAEVGQVLRPEMGALVTFLGAYHPDAESPPEEQP